MQRRRLLPWQLGAIALAIAGTGIGTTRLLRGSDHQDTPAVELNPRTDITDLYVFPGATPDRIVLVMNSSAFLTPAETPGATFDPDLLYQFKIDNTGDAKEDRVIQVTFAGTGANQQVEIRGPVAPPVVGAMRNTVADVSPGVTGAIGTTLGTAQGMQVFAGPRSDPFFIDLEAAFCILPDRKPIGGPLSTACALPPNPTPPFFFRDPGAARNYVAGFNVLSIVIELPRNQLEAAAPGRLGVWATISR